MLELAEQWIPAAQARQLVGSSSIDFHDSIGICTRANAGLIKARADLLIMDGKTYENGAIPPKFWWAQGHEALEQNWTTGDFSTWIDTSGRCEAFGVHFALDGLLQMLPVEKRAIVAKSVSVVGKAEWLSAFEARRFAYDRAGINPRVAADAVLDACRLGYITARAVLMRRADGGRPETGHFNSASGTFPYGIGIISPARNLAPKTGSGAYSAVRGAPRMRAAG